MTNREIRTLKITLEIELDAEQLDNLPQVDGSSALSPWFDAQTPTDGAFDLQTRCVDACIRAAFEIIERKQVSAFLEDAGSSLGKRHYRENPDQAFY